VTARGKNANANANAKSARRMKAVRATKRTRDASPLILVVDDFEDNRMMYAEYLTYSGFRVAEAANGVEAIEQAQTLGPDLIVMDLALPVLDGWEATRQLKQGEATKHIPVVALTGHALEGHSKRARAAGCDDFLVKPCLPEMLVRKVRELLSLDEKKRKRGA
jgi:CheY-like chemotaxis protein